MHYVSPGASWARRSADNLIWKLKEENRELREQLNRLPAQQLRQTQTATDLPGTLVLASAELRSALSKRHALAAPANRNLGTALAVKSVRMDLKALDPTGQVYKDVQYIAAANDAFRH